MSVQLSLALRILRRHTDPMTQYDDRTPDEVIDRLLSTAPPITPEVAQRMLAVLRSAPRVRVEHEDD